MLIKVELRYLNLRYICPQIYLNISSSTPVQNFIHQWNSKAAVNLVFLPSLNVSSEARICTQRNFRAQTSSKSRVGLFS